ncbi:MAG: hypothetical protein Q8K58_00560 [Acidimicrobiales bacterium]|nr:hypothetical protein [Acidimicrobiales bacterium]
MTPSDWLIVGVAGALASGVLGALVARPFLPAAQGSARLVAALLSVQAGLATVGGAALTGAAIRSWQLVDDDPAQQAAAGLVEVSRIDGDGRMYALVLLLLVALTACVTVLLALAARFATSADAKPRALACAVLGVEVAFCGYGVAQVISGSRNALAVGGVATLPLVMAALVACWPPRAQAAGR